MKLWVYTLLVVALLQTAALAFNYEFTVRNQFSDSISVQSITVDQNDDSIYVYGQKTATQVFLSKLSSNGTQLWHSPIGSQTYSGDLTTSHPLIDPETGDVFVSGWTRGTVDGQTKLNQSDLSAVNIGTLQGNVWYGLCWSPDLKLFLATAYSGSIYNCYNNTNGACESNSTFRLMTSPDGRTWTGRNVSAGYGWNDCTWSTDLKMFVVVGDSGTRNRVLTSPDGIAWTVRTSPSIEHSWRSVVWAHELGLFVAVADSGGVMTSSNGIDWTLGNCPPGQWRDIVWAPERGIFVSVSYNTYPNSVMTSSDGFNWKLVSTANNLPVARLTSITWSPELGIFVAVNNMGGSMNSIVSSTDAVTWTVRNCSFEGANFWSIAWSPEARIFMAVSWNMGFVTSSDGINWSYQYVWGHTIYVVWAPELSMMLAMISHDPQNGVIPVVLRFNEAGFVARLSSTNGALIWSRMLTQPTNTSLRVNSLKQFQQDLIVGGIARNSAGDDAFIQRLSKSTGTVVWNNVFGSATAADRLYAIEVDPLAGNIYAVGATKGNFGGQTIYGVGWDAFVSKHRLSDGALTLCQYIGTGRSDYAYAVVIDARRGDVYVAGTMGQGDLLNPQGLTFSATAGSNDIFLAQLSLKSLQLQWMRGFGSSSSADIAYEIVVSPSDGVVAVLGQVGAIPSSSGQQVFYGGPIDVCLATFAPNGTLLGSAIAGTSVSDFASAADASSDGTLVMAGAYGNQPALLVYGRPPAYQTATLTSVATETLVSQQSVSLTQTATRQSNIINNAYSTDTVVSQATTTVTEKIISISTSLVTATVTKELSGSGGNNNSNNSDASQQNVIIYAASAGVGGLAVGLLLSLFVSRRRSARGKKPGAAVNSFPMSVAAASNNMNASASAHVPISMYSMQSPQGNSTDWLNKEIATQNTEIPFSFYGKQRSQYM